jgi:hypothetical protein
MMATAEVDREAALGALRLIEEMIKEQRRKVIRLAQRLHPGLTDVDLRTLRDLPDVSADASWQFEDGQLAGMVAAKLMLKARLLEGHEAA